MSKLYPKGPFLVTWLNYDVHCSLYAVQTYLYDVHCSLYAVQTYLYEPRREKRVLQTKVTLSSKWRLKTGSLCAFGMAVTCMLSNKKNDYLCESTYILNELDQHQVGKALFWFLNIFMPQPLNLFGHALEFILFRTYVPLRTTLSLSPFLSHY